jgi:hypothetical protein
MTRTQRYQHESLVRGRDFGIAHVGVFPASSPGGIKFAQLAELVASIDEHMKNRVLGHAGTRGVDPTIRAKVFDYMRTLAQAARQMSRQRRSQVPFVLPRRRRLKVEVATSRAFLEAAETRQADFVGMGLPETFLGDFKALVDALDQAVDGRLTGKTMRWQARAGIADALRKGMQLLGDLDVIVAVVAREDEVVRATWRVARRVEGQKTAATADEPTAVVPSLEPAASTSPLLAEDAVEKAS